MGVCCGQESLNLHFAKTDGFSEWHTALGALGGTQSARNRLAQSAARDECNRLAIGLGGSQSAAPIAPWQSRNRGGSQSPMKNVADSTSLDLLEPSLGGGQRDRVAWSCRRL